MANAIWNVTVLAENEDYKMVEGNIYFPPESVKNEYLQDSGKDYECPWKGHADFYNIIVGDKVNVEAAWSYTDPKPAARQIKEHMAFDRGKSVLIEM